MDLQPILEEIGNNCLDIAKNKSGCCVLQHCLAQPGCGRGRGRLLHVIINHAYQLANNEYGNYVIQFVISMRSDAINTKVMKKLEGSFATLAESKYGSHVVERCLKDFRDDMVKLIIEELCDAPNFFDILDHQMGNYVAQTTLHRSKAMLGCSYTKSPHQMLVSRINTYYAFLKGREYGKRVLNHVKCKCKLEEFGFNVDYFY